MTDTGRPSRRRVGIIAGTGFAGVVAILMLAAPLASASGVTSFSPPYTAFTSSLSNSLSSSGCTATAHESGSPAWSASTGTFTMAAAVSSGTCLSGYSYASVFATATINSPTFSGTHGGTSYVYVSWSLAVAAKAALTATPSNVTGNYSYADSSVSGTVYAYLLDVTNGSVSYVSTSSATLFGTTLYSTGLYVLRTGPTSSYLFLSGVLHKGHSYQLELFVDVGVSVYVYSTTATGSASVNLAGTNGLTLSSITIY